MGNQVPAPGSTEVSESIERFFQKLGSFVATLVTSFFSMEHREKVSIGAGLVVFLIATQFASFLGALGTGAAVGLVIWSIPYIRNY